MSHNFNHALVWHIGLLCPTSKYINIKDTVPSQGETLSLTLRSARAVVNTCIPNRKKKCTEDFRYECVYRYTPKIYGLVDPAHKTRVNYLFTNQDDSVDELTDFMIWPQHFVEIKIISEKIYIYIYILVGSSNKVIA